MGENNQLNSWKKFEDKAQEIALENSQNSDSCQIIFRGHSNSEWKLESSLERFSSKDFSFREYQRLLDCYLKNPIFCLTKGKVDLIKYEDHVGNIPEYIEYMVYLRHHGFPSPLLDWTESPYVALFFAFNGVTNEQINNDKSIKIFTYQAHRQEKGTCHSPSKANIHDIGPNLKTDKRHYTQQCRYTICLKENNEDEKFYCKHEDGRGNKSGGNFIKEYTIPCKLREEFLKKLNQMNINAFTLFENEEGLMSMLANKYLR